MHTQQGVRFSDLLVVKNVWADLSFLQVADVQPLQVWIRTFDAFRKACFMGYNMLKMV